MSLTESEDGFLQIIIIDYEFYVKKLRLETKN